jgi:hypothetical protein
MLKLHPIDSDATNHGIMTSTSLFENQPSVAIDDFLINYRHRQSSIQEFLSCLDNCDLAEGQTMVGKSSFHGLSSHSTSQLTSTSPSEVDLDSESSSLESKATIHTEQFGTSACKQVCKANQPKKTIKCKQDISEKEKDERRRFQNREAQRRFRERQMREEYRRASIHQHGQLLAWLQTKATSKL